MIFYNYDHLPFLPVRLFKKYKLLSIREEKIIKIMNSSGTSGQEVSKIYLDKENANLQIKILTKIVSTVLGNKRLPMLVIDSKSIIEDRHLFSARGAGVIGFSIFGKRRFINTKDFIKEFMSSVKCKIVYFHEGKGMSIFKKDNPHLCRLVFKKKLYFKRIFFRLPICRRWDAGLRTRFGGICD